LLQQTKQNCNSLYSKRLNKYNKHSWEELQMNIREINKPVTAKSLNESMAKRFGKKVALEKFTLEQLQNVRNKVRTTLSQVETNESFNSVQTTEYQKNKLFLDVLNAEISEREHIAEANDCDKTCPKSCPDCGGTGDPEKFKAMQKEAVDQNDDGKNNFDDVKIARMMASGMSKEEAIAKLKKKNESVIKEGAEDEAELVMASKDMVDRVTSWMEDTAEMQTESMLELADAIRDEKGQEASDAFVQTVKPALESLYSAMESTRQSLIQGVGQLTGEAEPAMDMGAEPEGEEPAMEPTVDQDAAADTGVDLGGEDDFGAAAPAAGGEEEAGRAKRESVKRSKKSMLETSRRLGTILSKKK
jgi:hypothetical protein